MLVVEDDLVIQSCCRTVLESAGIIVDACDTVADGKRLFAAHRPDLAVLDIGLPDGTGLDLLREWNNLPGSKVPVIFLTARGDLKTRLDCFRQGAQDYIQKPFAPEELLARAQVHLQQRQTQDVLVRRNSELEVVARARQDLTDMIVHDLKSPLAAIKGTIDLIKGQGLISSQEHESLLKHAGTAADFMLLMLNDLLDISQAKQTGLRPDVELTEVVSVFDKLRELFAERSRKMSVDLSCSTSPGGEKILTDPKLLFRVLANLISNAMAVSPRDGVVEVTCGLSGAAARLTVSDRGRGVPDDLKQPIFEKFTTTNRGGLEAGSGIGLTFCRVAAQALQGRIWVEDRPGGGACFHLEFPQTASAGKGG